MDNIKVSVIICCYSLDRLNDLREAYYSVLKQSLPPQEIIISVDHNEELRDKLIAELSPSARIVHNDGIKGLSETRNTGIRVSTADILAFIDDDAVAEPDWLENLVKPFSDLRVMAVGGKALPSWYNGEKPAGFADELNWILGCTYEGMSLNRGTVRNVIGCNMAFRRKVFDSIGYFNTNLGRTGKKFGANEETEICMRISRSAPDSLIVYQPDAIIYHKVPIWRTKLRYIIQRSFDEGVNKSRLIAYQGNKSSLNTEASYLKYLLIYSIPRRVAIIWTQEALYELAAILLSMTTVAFGFLFCKVRNIINRGE